MIRTEHTRAVFVGGVILLAAVFSGGAGRSLAQPEAGRGAPAEAVPGAREDLPVGAPASTSEERYQERMREIEKMRAERAAASRAGAGGADFSSADADGDGKYTEAELTELVKMLMAGADGDSDSLLDDRELMRMFSDGMRSAAMSRRPPSGAGAASGGDVSAEMQERLRMRGIGEPGAGANTRFGGRGAGAIGAPGFDTGAGAGAGGFNAGVPGAGYNPALGSRGAGVPGAGAPGAGLPAGGIDRSALTNRGGSREISDLIMARMDTNGDGRIQREEAPQVILDAFEELDSDANGSLGPEDGERMKMLRERMADRTGGAASAAVPGAPGVPSAPGPGSSPMAHYIQRFDKDADGALSRAELPEHMHRLFEVLDSDGDGSITTDEFENRTRPGRGVSEPPGVRSAP